MLVTKFIKRKRSQEIAIEIIFPQSAPSFFTGMSRKMQRNRQLRTYRSNKGPTFRGTPRRYRESAVKFACRRKVGKLLQIYLYAPSEFRRAYVRCAQRNHLGNGCFPKIDKYRGALGTFARMHGDKPIG